MQHRVYNQTFVYEIPFLLCYNHLSVFRRYKYLILELKAQHPVHTISRTKITNTTCYYVNVYCTKVHSWLCVNLATYVSKVLHKHAAIQCTHCPPKYSYINIHNRSRTHVQVHGYVESIGWKRRARRRDPQEGISYNLSVAFKCIASFYMMSILLNRNRESPPSPSPSSIFVK